MSRIDDKLQELMGEDDELVVVVRPSWWKFSGYMLLSPLIVPFLIGAVKRYSLGLYIYNRKIVVTRGLFTTNMKVIFIEDIRTINVEQSVLERVLGYGTLMIAASGTSEYEEIAQGVSDPVAVKNLILLQRRRNLEGGKEVKDAPVEKLPAAKASRKKPAAKQEKKPLPKKKGKRNRFTI